MASRRVYTLLLSGFSCSSVAEGTTQHLSPSIALRMPLFILSLHALDVPSTCTHACSFFYLETTSCLNARCEQTVVARPSLSNSWNPHKCIVLHSNCHLHNKRQKNFNEIPLELCVFSHYKSIVLSISSLRVKVL